MIPSTSKDSAIVTKSSVSILVRISSKSADCKISVLVTTSTIVSTSTVVKKPTISSAFALLITFCTSASTSSSVITSTITLESSMIVIISVTSDNVTSIFSDAAFASLTVSINDATFKAESGAVTPKFAYVVLIAN